MNAKRILRTAGIALIFVGLAMAATYTAPAPQSSRPNWATNRFSTPVAGFLTIGGTTAGVDDGDVTLDAQLAGYLERLTFSADGNDTSWTFSVLDVNSVVLFTKADCNMAAGTYSFPVSMADVDGTSYGRIPFADGLTVRIADANDGDGNGVSYRLYLTEVWRR